MYGWNAYAYGVYNAKQMSQNPGNAIFCNPLGYYIAVTQECNVTQVLKRVNNKIKSLNVLTIFPKINYF